MTAFHRSTEWARLVKAERPKIERRLPLPCVDCGRAVFRTDRWQVGHILPASLYPELRLRPSNLGPSHGGVKGRACNQKSGGALGAAITNRRRARRERGEFPDL